MVQKYIIYSLHLKIRGYNLLTMIIFRLKTILEGGVV
jgi:hypothetical protein